MTTALAVPDTTGIQTKTVDITERSQAMLITDFSSYGAGGEFLRSVKGVLKQISDTFDEPISAAHLAHKTILEARNSHADPLKAAERIVKQKMVTWKREEEARQAEERRRLEAEERKREEERRLAEAERLEAQGRNDEAEQVIDAPVVMPSIVMPSAAPKISGVSTRKVWRHRIVDVNKIPRQFMLPNEKAIAAHVRAMGAAATIPGIEVVQEEIMAVGSG